MSARITTPFTRESTAAEVLAGVDLSGQRAIVTGGASGIGVETARALVNAGAEVHLAVRNTEAGEKVAAEVGAAGVRHLELADRASVARFAADWQGPLHILVNNAGVMASPLTRTAEGWELQFATNHLGHFGLTTGLHRALAAAGGARVVSVSSSAHLRAGVDFDDLHFERRAYEPWVAYGQSKTANVLFAVEAAKRWAADGIAVNALMPGGIRTALQRHVDPAVLDAMAEGFQWSTTEQGAATSVLLAGSPLVDGVTGRYFEKCAEAEPAPEGATMGMSGVAAYALDPEAARKLWDVSVALLSS
ncbi:NAD(P)-dependent dehydrogenase (short-subunit alcohol dehydrogenase family) [Crossiella equi]|uniref:NAD(P)-dependent dehydrogenase (Short-subunit alcohol dehydrogenase family) n=1 Tax=Crossiella equi TaxID=130796 RepID=A0ABS5AFE6_9PSEU|nr:SDR family NAD(P)-dependent oxidoreductase [Crossiella equi]MBP2475306.1 NAD(P)-dependent dehydrogenase (short-subunit alcohol dehydrogenase family) [Crossiella equi]